uniref:Annexin 3 n=1 Tax=Spironucleus vortens TaxID=58336 RepID=A0A142C671_SPIVO|nr:annexin 3 [Spironucleus vortens]
MGCSASVQTTPKDSSSKYGPMQGKLNINKINAAIDDIVKACKGAGTDEQVLINITANCNSYERDAIVDAYMQKYNKSLSDLLKSELSGNLDKLFVGMYTNRKIYWAEQINEAVKGAGTDEKKLIDLVVSLGTEFIDVDRLYNQMYKNCIHETIVSECGNAPYSKLLQQWLTASKSHNETPEKTAEDLFKAADGAGTNEDVFIKIMTTMYPQHYQKVDAEFNKRYQKSLRSVIKAEFSGKSEYAFLAVHDYLMAPPRFIANMLYTAVKGLGTNDDQIIYCTVLHADVFAKHVASAYSHMGLGDLKKDIKGDLSGKYEKAVLAFWKL